ncbi:hypothetical protein IW147_006271, partial [Coemansia sp. RSA 720]
DELAGVAAAGESSEAIKLVSFRKFDFVANDSDNYRRVDISLILGAGNTSSSTDAVPEYKNVVLFIEVKQYTADQAQTYLQLVLYSRNLFATLAKSSNYFDGLSMHVGLQTWKRLSNPVTLGTLPFMSIGNLEQSKVKRTALDDWESLIYVLCWLDTVGINQADQDCEAVRDLQIGKWQKCSALGDCDGSSSTKSSDVF